jgi:cytochrome c-type biogenesis protein
MRNILFGGTLLTAFLGGLVALLAPCCISVMLPAYLATGFRRRAGILAATLIFALGVATIIVPIGLGAAALISLVSARHTLVFAVAATAMLAGGIAILFGWKPQIPMWSGRAPTGKGYFSVYGLGVFSGAATSCCAPVLIGVSILSGAAASFPAALAVALTYVVGMVAPLALFALIWDKRDWGASKWTQGRQVTLGVGRFKRRMAIGTAASGFLLIGMAVLAYLQAAAGPGMGANGWLVSRAADLQHFAVNITKALAWIPGWVVALLLVIAIFFIIRSARRYLSQTNSESVASQPFEASSECCTPMAIVTEATTEEESRI